MKIKMCWIKSHCQKTIMHQSFRRMIGGLTFQNSLRPILIWKISLSMSKMLTFLSTQVIGTSKGIFHYSVKKNQLVVWRK